MATFFTAIAARGSCIAMDFPFGYLAVGWPFRGKFLAIELWANFVERRRGMVVQRSANLSKRLIRSAGSARSATTTSCRSVIGSGDSGAVEFSCILVLAHRQSIGGQAEIIFTHCL
jgi:hypothetical protein